MNKANLNALIEHLKKVDAATFNMDYFQKVNLMPAATYEALHECGNTACIAGHMALLPEFQKMGGIVRYYGGPAIEVEGEELEDSKAFAFFAGISYKEADRFIYPVFPHVEDTFRPIVDLTRMAESGEAPVDETKTILVYMVAAGWEKPGDPLPQELREWGQGKCTLESLWENWTPAHAVRILEYLVKHGE